MALRVFIVLFSEAAEANGTTVGVADAGTVAEGVLLSLDGTVVVAVSILIAELTCISTLALMSADAPADALSADAPAAAAAWAASAALTSVAVILTSEVKV